MKRNPFVEIALAAVVIGALLAIAAPALGQPSSDHRQANALYKEGVRLYNAGEYAGALDLFENAYHRYADPRILFSIATTLRQMGRTVEAANAYQRYVDDPSAEPQFVSDTQTVLKLLDATIGKVEIVFDGPAGEVQVEDGEWMPSGTKIVRVEPGSFVVRGRRDGFTAEAVGRVTAGASVTLTLHWTAVEAAKPVAKPTTPPPPAAAKPAEPAAPDPADSSVHTRRVIALSVGGGGAALAIGALVLELSSRSAISDAESTCPSLRCAEPAYGQAQALLDQASSRRTAAIVVGGVATVAIAAGAALWLTAHPSETRLHVAPVAGDHTVGLVIGGRF